MGTNNTLTDEEVIRKAIDLTFKDLNKRCYSEFNSTSNWLTCLKTITDRGKTLSQLSEIKGFVHTQNLNKFNTELDCIAREIDAYRIVHQEIELTNVKKFIERFLELRIYIDGQVT